MKILCVYYDEETRLLERPPSEILTEHEVIEVHTQRDAREIIEDPLNGIQIVLCDSFFPYHSGDREVKCIEPNGITLFMLARHYSVIQGFGLFMVDQQESDGLSQTVDGFSEVASKECKDIQGNRDWKKLLGLVLEEIER